MSRIGELLLKAALRLKEVRAKNGRGKGHATDGHATNGHAGDATSDHGSPAAHESQDWARYIRWQYDSSKQLFAKYPNFDVAGKTVLEIGCGTGGRAAYLAAAGASRVVAMDINAEEIAIARKLVPELFPEIGDRVRYLTNTDDEAIGQFDIVVLVDCLEHVVSPPDIIRLAYDHTVAGGKCYISSIGWYHKDGSHTGLLPFVNVVFSDETILNVTRWNVSRPEYTPTRFDSNPPIERWRGIYDLRQRPGEYLNKITLREMKRLVAHSIYPRASMHVLGLRPSSPLARLVNPLRHIPIVQEVAHSYVVIELQR